jgi:L-ascorbate metabolism protein UlaG (beta-lactamase superfamily)
MPTPVPADATFRRAEGLIVVLRPCRGLGFAEVVARGHGGDRRGLVSLDDLRLLGRLARWRRAGELDVPLERLLSLVERDLVFWSRERSERHLGGAPLEPLAGRVALRDAASPAPVIATPDGGFAPFPEMVRRGDRVALAGTAFVAVEWDTIVWTLVISCCERHRQMAAELGVALDGTRDVGEIATGGEPRALLERMNDLGWLERHEPPAPRDGAPRVTWMGHAGVLYEAAGRRILVDTIAFPRSAPTRHAARPFDLRDLGALDAVLITHGDNDHFHPGLLYRIPRHTPVVIPSCRDPRPYQVDMRGLLERFGFERIVEVDEWQRLDLGAVTVVAAPFRGEDWGLSLPCRTYVIASRELTIYLNADSTSTPEAYERIAAEHRVDLAFLGVTGAEESLVMPPGFGYGDFYAQWIPRERRNEWVKMCNGPRESAEVARRLRARYAFGYAAGGVPFYSTAYCDRGTHGELAACLEGETRGLELRLAEPTAVPA